MKHAVILFSGGLDSTTILAEAATLGYTLNALTVDYGQRHRVELDAARRIAQKYAVREHRIIQVDLRSLSASSLLNDEAVPQDRADMTDIPSTYVPARNTIFLSLALSYAESIGAYDIFYGANSVDYSSYPDCRPEYLEAFQALANLATADGVNGRRFTIHAPLMYLSKADIVRKGLALNVDHSMTHTCYDPVGVLACGHCDACLLHKRGFMEAQVSDPTRYVQNSAPSIGA